jgi:hypothetical protein
MGEKIAVLIRVYDRIEDLELNVQIINDLWNAYNYEVYVVFNGESNGYKLNNNIKENVQKIISLKENAGHIKGNSQLLLEGIKNINIELFDYLIILEADTWLMNDQLIEKYIKILDNTNAKWASAKWVEKRHSLSVEFAIINTNFIKEHFHKIFDFTNMAEVWVAEYMMKNNINFMFIKELTPTHRPSLIKSIYNADFGRIRVLPSGNMVTHHIETLEGGMAKKRELADIVYKNNYFTNKSKFNLFFLHYLYLLLQITLKFIPKSSWFKKKKYYFKDNK